jgi:hypothetical protein
MIAWKLKLWRSAGAAAVIGLAACGGEAGEAGAGGETGEAGEAGEAGISAPAPSPATATAPAGGEAGEAGAATAYAGLSGDQLTALRLQHLKGFVMAAARLVADDQPAEAGVLVSQGLLEVYDVAPNEFGSFDAAIVRAAADGTGLNRAQMMQRIRASNAEIDRAMAGLDMDSAVLVVRMVDIATGLYQGVVQEDFVDAIEYQHAMGAALGARDALAKGQSALRGADVRAYSRAQNELDRFVALWRTSSAPENPATYREVLAQGSRVRLALSPFL